MSKVFTLKNVKIGLKIRHLTYKKYDKINQIFNYKTTSIILQTIHKK